MADTVFYTEMQDLAVELLNDFGVAMVIRRRTTSSVAADGTVTESANTTTNTLGVLIPASEDKDNAEEYESLAGKEVRCLIISAKGMSFIPRSHDECVVGSAVWHIASCTPMDPTQAAPIYHRCPVVLL